MKTQWKYDLVERPKGRESVVARVHAHVMFTVT